MSTYEIAYSFIHKLDKWSCVYFFKVTIFIGNQPRAFMAILTVC